ncbi:hypothetical protein PVAP13_1KG462105 [Panicum virgatum]|uniref:Uncharacterized protein n=1 Tax=Panicum virgatum TaxID=38727 RepID=A0A8T0XH83_PANVG|nr:hypothetical protein PVAP13_1KG462105 [Panicum virgatum]
MFLQSLWNYRLECFLLLSASLSSLPQFQFCFIPLLQNILDLLFNVWNCIDGFAREEMQAICSAS